MARIDASIWTIPNILVERLWRTLKYEELYLRAHSDGWKLEIGLPLPVEVLR